MTKEQLESILTDLQQSKNIKQRDIQDISQAQYNVSGSSNFNSLKLLVEKNEKQLEELNKKIQELGGSNE